MWERGQSWWEEQRMTRGSTCSSESKVDKVLYSPEAPQMQKARSPSFPSAKCAHHHGFAMPTLLSNYGTASMCLQLTVGSTTTYCERSCIVTLPRLHFHVHVNMGRQFSQAYPGTAQEGCSLEYNLINASQRLSAKTRGKTLEI